MTSPLRAKYGAFYDKWVGLLEPGVQPINQLKPDRIPKEFWPLIPYAEFWGVTDDGFRIDLTMDAPPEIWKDLRDTVAPFDQALTDWLAGPDADRPHPSLEYVAFSFMHMAYGWPRD